MMLKEQREYIRAFEQAYGTTVSRCWFNVRKGWLEYITHSTSSVIVRPFRVDLQRCSVLDLCSAAEAVKMIGDGILKDYEDRNKMNEQAHRHLGHICG